MNKYFKLFLILLVIFLIAEFGVRFSHKLSLQKTAPISSRAEDYADKEDFENWMKNDAKATAVHASMGNVQQYEPYTGVFQRPNINFKFKNYEFFTNSLGFRSREEITMPKPKNTYRIFI